MAEEEDEHQHGFKRLPDMARDVPPDVQAQQENYTGNPKHAHPAGPWFDRKVFRFNMRDGDVMVQDENPCRQRTKKVWVNQETLHKQRVPLYYRDYCAHMYIPWRNCLIDHSSFNPLPGQNICGKWKEAWDLCQVRDVLDRMAERRCLKEHGLWRKVPFSNEIFDRERDTMMVDDNGFDFGYTRRGRPKIGKKDKWEEALPAKGKWAKGYKPAIIEDNED